MALTDPVSVEVHGLAELEKGLLALGEAAAGKALSAAMAAGMGVLRKEAQGQIPVGAVPHYIGSKAKGKLVQPGNLRKQLRVRRVRDEKYSKRLALTYSGMGFYGIFIEFGVGGKKGLAPLRKAFDTSRERMLEKFKERLATSIKKQAEKTYLESLRAGR